LYYLDDFAHRNGGPHCFVNRGPDPGHPGRQQQPKGPRRPKTRRWWMRTRTHCFVGSLRRWLGVYRGFTLIEVLPVILIILMVSAVALPTVVTSLSHRQMREAGAILQGALVGARDKAIHDGQPSGIRLLPDPTYPISWTPSGTINPYTVLAYSRIIPI